MSPVEALAQLRLDQVCIGSCTNSSFADMMKVAAILKGKSIAPWVSLTISPGSRQVLSMLAGNGALQAMIDAGARILESGCGPCIGMGQAPATNAVSLRTFNRNFCGRSGTPSAQVYLCSPETAAVSALTGYITDPRTFEEVPPTLTPDSFPINDNMIAPPAAPGEAVEVVRGPNIKPFPLGHALGQELSGQVLIRLGDDITTDHIMPSGAKLLPYRSNVPYLAGFCLSPCDPEFPAGPGLRAAGSSWPGPTTARAPAGSMRRCAPWSWASRRCWPSPSPASTRPT